MINLEKNDFNFFIDNKYKSNIYHPIQYTLILFLMVYITVTFITDYNKVNRLEKFVQANEVYTDNKEINYSNEYDILAEQLDHIYKYLNDIILTSVNTEEKSIIVNGKSKDMERIKKYSVTLSKKYFKAVSIKEIKKLEEEYVFRISCEL